MHGLELEARRQSLIQADISAVKYLILASIAPIAAVLGFLDNAQQMGIASKACLSLGLFSLIFAAFNYFILLVGIIVISQHGDPDARSLKGYKIVFLHVGLIDKMFKIIGLSPVVGVLALMLGYLMFFIAFLVSLWT